MKAAPCSWRVRMSLIDELRKLSTTSRFSSPGTPKMRSTPSFSSAATRRSDPLGISVLPNFSFNASILRLLRRQVQLLLGPKSSNDALDKVGSGGLAGQIRGSNRPNRGCNFADPSQIGSEIDIYRRP